MILLAIAIAFSKQFSLVELDLERHATKIKVLSLELENTMSQNKSFSPAHIEFLSEKIHTELILIGKELSEF